APGEALDQGGLAGAELTRQRHDVSRREQGGERLAEAACVVGAVEQEGHGARASKLLVWPALTSTWAMRSLLPVTVKRSSTCCEPRVIWMANGVSVTGPRTTPSMTACAPGSAPTTWRRAGFQRSKGRRICA